VAILLGSVPDPFQSQYQLLHKDSKRVPNELIRAGALIPDVAVAAQEGNNSSSLSQHDKHLVPAAQYVDSLVLPIALRVYLVCSRLIDALPACWVCREIVAMALS
jgi:hypothetical protein